MVSETLRLRLGKTSAARYISHLDLMRAVDRAVRRSGLPVALTEGFHPHYRIGYGPALPLGATSASEYLDLIPGGPMDAEDARKVLNDSLPCGLRVLAAQKTDAGHPLTALTTRASYVVQLDHRREDDDVLNGIWQRIISASEYVVEKQTHKGIKRVDIRRGLKSWSLHPSNTGTVLRLLVVTGAEGNLRPEDAVSPLCDEGARLALIHRAALYGEDRGLLTDPFGQPCPVWPDNEILLKEEEACRKSSW